MKNRSDMEKNTLKVKNSNESSNSEGDGEVVQQIGVRSEYYPYRKSRVGFLVPMSDS